MRQFCKRKNNKQSTYIKNSFQGHCISNLQKPVNSVGSRDEVFGDSLLKDLEKTTKCYLKILEEFSDLYSSRTKLDQERSRMYERDLEEVLKVSAAARTALNKNMLEGTIDKLNHLRTKMESLADDPQSGVPDVIVWLESGSKRVGHARVRARELLYAVREYERGAQSGKTITLFLKCLGRRGEDTLLAKVECYLWLGVAKQMDYCFRDLPQGFSVEYGFEAPDDTERMPKTLHYLEKRVFQLRAHIYQARSLPSRDRTRYPSCCAKVIFRNHVKCTQVRENSLNPIWDEMLLFPEIEFYGDVHHTPVIVVEVHNYGAISEEKSFCNSSLQLFVCLSINLLRSRQSRLNALFDFLRIWLECSLKSLKKAFV
ncbi:Otoferlin [Araneus ventricosus]|uniref:Otoferlin n=1 Tax=Araneus ventricosus TaxID=182803 RepID=A0A4Y2Q3J3_ARAVE|nr:Otoferlin [Araneus ventricosus]